MKRKRGKNGEIKNDCRERGEAEGKRERRLIDFIASAKPIFPLAF